MNAQVAALVEKGVPADAARSAVLARLSSPTQDHRSNQDREMERVEQQLLAARIPPAIARAAAEGRIHEPPEVTRAKAAAEALEKKEELERRYGRER
ncbi:hypothetical protein [Nocardia sp. NPDC002869]|uniref:hypothetical protein n=1 Tax=Nocardia sp. NPDC002869 TaxID=3161032 RepID=UPI00398D5572